MPKRADYTSTEEYYIAVDEHFAVVYGLDEGN